MNYEQGHPENTPQGLTPHEEQTFQDIMSQTNFPPQMTGEASVFHLYLAPSTVPDKPLPSHEPWLDRGQLADTQHLVASTNPGDPSREHGNYGYVFNNGKVVKYDRSDLAPATETGQTRSAEIAGAARSPVQGMQGRRTRATGRALNRYADFLEQPGRFRDGLRAISDQAARAFRAIGNGALLLADTTISTDPSGDGGRQTKLFGNRTAGTPRLAQAWGARMAADKRPRPGRRGRHIGVTANVLFEGGGQHVDPNTGAATGPLFEPLRDAWQHGRRAEVVGRVAAGAVAIPIARASWAARAIRN